MSQALYRRRSTRARRRRAAWSSTRAAGSSPSARRSTDQIFPRPGWVEHDPARDLEQRPGGRRRTRSTKAQLRSADLVALGITNQRETTVRVGPRDRRAGAQRDQLAGHAHRPPRAASSRGDVGPGPLPRPLRAAARHLLLRPEDPLAARPRRRACRRAPRPASVLFGTMDTLADLEPHRPPHHRRHQRRPHDADEPRDARLGRRAARRDRRAAGDAAGDPLRRPRSTARRAARSPASRSRRALGDQHAALFGQTCFAPGEAKCTYGTGSFLLHEHRRRAGASANGLLTTVGYKIGDEPPTYALEGSIAVTGALVQWFRDNLGADRLARRRSRRWRARSRTTAAATSSPRSPACSRRTGAATRAA